jgi:DnaK suppressor protein
MKKEVILELKEKIEKELEQLSVPKKIETIDEWDAKGDEVDAIQSNIIVNIAKALDGRQKERVALLNKALGNIKSGTFGICEECGEEIEDKRLLFNPCFTICIACAETIEKEKKRLRQ